nr:unnamed protein product [Callosobruchus analis]
MFGKTSLCVMVLYIPPTEPLSTYENVFELLCSIQALHDSNIMILGDFNISGYSAYSTDGVESTIVRSLNNFRSFYSLEQYNYVYNSNMRLLDIVLCNIYCCVDRCEDALLAEDLHHPALVVSVDRLRPKPESKLDKVQFYDTLNTIFSYCVPKYCASKCHRRFPPWFNGCIIRDIRSKEILFRTLKRNPSEDTLCEYKALRTKIKRDIDIAYKNYIKKCEDDIKRDPIKFWSFINSKRCQGNIPNNMKYNGMEMNDPQNI